jgi:hypothetical protein
VTRQTISSLSEETRVYDVNDAREFLSAAGIDVDVVAP